MGSGFAVEVCRSLLAVAGDGDCCSASVSDALPRCLIARRRLPARVDREVRTPSLGCRRLARRPASRRWRIARGSLRTDASCTSRSSLQHATVCTLTKVRAGEDHSRGAECDEAKSVAGPAEDPEAASRDSSAVSCDLHTCVNTIRSSGSEHQLPPSYAGPDLEPEPEPPGTQSGAWYLSPAAGAATL